MPIEIRLPQLGMGMHVGTVTVWYKKEGDSVEEGEPLAEVEAAKVTEDLPAPCSGVLERIVVAEGATAAVNEVLAVIVPGEEAPRAAEDHRAATEDGSTATFSETAARPEPPKTAASPRGEVTPRARRLAQELGVDLATVSGSGPDGRVTEEDVTWALDR